VAEADSNYRVIVADGNASGTYYALRTAEHTLIETGWIDLEGNVFPDQDVDGSSPAAMVPIKQEWI
jgi:hypothetical protein